jgi:ClpP class serine protease
MRFANITNAVYRQPWNITPGGWLSVHELLQSRLAVDAENLDLSAFVNPRPDLEVDSNGIAHIHVTGVLGKNLSQIERSCGNTGYEQLETEVADAVKAEARGILLHVNSPGGAATGNVETSRMVAGSGLPTVAWVDELAASAAYAIASGATLIVVSPSAQVGSIGTILPLVDTSGQWEQRGLKPAYITHTGGDLKDATWPPSFSEAHREHLQEMVDDFFGQFREHVQTHRDVQASAMRGQTLLGTRAKAANLVDRIGSYSEAYDQLLKHVNSI